jgi:hypothetical protein
VLRDASGVRVEFETPIQAVVRGQFAVFFAGERVLGGGVIQGAIPSTLPLEASLPSTEVSDAEA